MKLLKVLSSVAVTVVVVVTSSLVSVPDSASAYHKTNKWDRRANRENGWVVFYSKEISHVEEAKIALAIIADSTVSAGGATSAYFATFAVGKETYNRAECTKIFNKERCVSTPNTFQPYIRIKK